VNHLQKEKLQQVPSIEEKRREDPKQKRTIVGNLGGIGPQLIEVDGKDNEIIKG
jgi:hypothetical protein